ncbi:tRNA dihydrouridine synthase DusB [Granulicoccus sp. GXG6511]|uniref:tRNA dihydrouridine synthase DusB n=1 Tax=Granulicoccus sp. GXG6511 TaxID=3381351 RepID=UPI003D7C81E4
MQTLPAYAPLVLAAPSRPGAVTSTTPVVLAPMAGVTNAAYRQLCREQAEAGGEPGTGRKGLFVCEMITSRGLVERDRKSLDMLAFDPGETLHSVQLYGVDPATMAHATEILCNEFGVAHVDLNFGCPVPKVTRKGGGGVLPWKRDRLRAILTATVAAADRYGVPVTMKTRKGIDADHLTYLDAGRIAEESGCAAIALHGRTVAQSYSGEADWDAIAELVAAVDIPVLGNGDIWEAETALRMVEHTGCAGVVVGRGCLGRPWLFRDLADAFAGRSERTLPNLGEVAATVRRHGELMASLMGEKRGLADLRKHMAWYFKGYPVGGDARRGLAMVSSVAELDDRLAQLDPAAPFPTRELGAPRGRQGSPRAKVVMPDGWLADRSGLALDLSGAESDVSGG